MTSTPDALVAAPALLKEESTAPATSFTLVPTAGTEVEAVDVLPEGEKFDALVARHVEGYRPPSGALVHPTTVKVADPHHVDDEALLASSRHYDRRGWQAWLAGVLLLTASIVAAIAFGNAVLALSLQSVALASIVGAFRCSARMEGLKRSATAKQLQVPSDVATAYRNYRDAPRSLRRAGADETVVAGVEEHLPYADDLLVEAARLHAVGASTTEEALAVRDALVRLAANAQTLTVLAQRRKVMIEAAALATPSLLMRHPDEGGFTRMGNSMMVETEFVREVLDGPTTPLPRT
jgi:hypothetical protein